MKRWYDIVKKWGRAISAEKCRETFERVHDLSSFLKRLERDLSEEVGKLFLALLIDFLKIYLCMHASICACFPLLQLITQLLRWITWIFFFVMMKAGRFSTATWGIERGRGRGGVGKRDSVQGFRGLKSGKRLKNVIILVC